MQSLGWCFARARALEDIARRATAVAVFGAAMIGGPFVAPAAAQFSNDTVKIGVLDDLSGFMADDTGPGDVLAARLAVEDFGGTVLGRKIEVVEGDHQNKADVGVAVARQWYDVEHVVAIFGLSNSAVALAVQRLTKEKNRINITTAAGAPALTGDQRSPNGIHWTYDNYAMGRATVLATIRAGGKKWFFITANYSFGISLEESAAALIVANGGEVVGRVRHPTDTADFSSFILQAMASGADVIALANAGQDLVNAVKQLDEYGARKQGAKIVAFVAHVTNMHALGLKAAQGLSFADTFNWDQNAEARAFSKRFEDVLGKPPNGLQASVYGAVMHYLKAVKATGTDDAQRVMAQMKATRINDFMTKDGYIREDGRVIRDLLVYRVKTPSESTGPWDLLEQIDVIPGEEAFRPLAEGGCPYLKAQ